MANLIEYRQRLDLRRLCTWAGGQNPYRSAIEWPSGSRILYALRRDPDGRGRLDLRWWVDEQQVNVSAELVTTSQRLGGRRWWVLCPRCGRRCAVLALTSRASGAGCRRCLGLTYASQSEGRTDRALRALAKLRERYGSEACGPMSVMAKPDRVHWSTWYRVMAREARYRRQSLDGILGRLAGLERRTTRT
ncbi:MAG: hypothetical protein EOO70_02720 [Myxococcaceae bacterium]|nr:MAG: hypothetical protein EOO70_02720 [Myxococcaceae bacterium]